VPCAML